MASNLSLSGHQATLTVHSMMRRPPKEKVNVVVKVGEEPSATGKSSVNAGVFDDIDTLNPTDFLTRLEFNSKLELFVQAQTNLVTACEKLREENHELVSQQKELQRKVYVLEELLKNNSQVTTRLNVIDNSISKLNQEIGRIRKDVTFLAEDQNTCRASLKEVKASFEKFTSKTDRTNAEKALVRRAVNAILKSRPLIKLQNKVAYNDEITTNLTTRLQAAEGVVSKLQQLTAGTNSERDKLDKLEKRTALLETSSTLRPLKMLQLGEDDTDSDIDDEDDEPRVKKNSDIYNRLDLLEKANFTIRLALGEKISRNHRKNNQLQGQVDVLRRNADGHSFANLANEIERRLNGHDQTMSVFKSMINNLIVDVDGQKTMQNKEILRLDRQLRSLRSNGNEWDDKSMTPRYMRPKGAPAANQLSSFRKSLINNEPFRLREAQNNRTSGILSSGSSSPKLKIRLPTSSKDREPYRRSSVKFFAERVEKAPV